MPTYSSFTPDDSQTEITLFSSDSDKNPQQNQENEQQSLHEPASSVADQIQPEYYQDTVSEIQSVTVTDEEVMPTQPNAEDLVWVDQMKKEQDRLRTITDTQIKERTDMTQQSIEQIPAPISVSDRRTAALVAESVSAGKSIPIDELVIQPSVTLLVFRLLGAGLVILFILFLMALTVDMIRFAFGDQVLTLLNNRGFTFTLGIMIYIVIGFVIYKQWSSVVYTITLDKLMIDKGWLNKSRQTRDINQFGGVQARQTLLGKILQYGDLNLDYHGAIGKVASERMLNIPHPFKYERILAAMIEQNR